MNHSNVFPISYQSLWREEPNVENCLWMVYLFHATKAWKDIQTIKKFTVKRYINHTKPNDLYRFAVCNHKPPEKS
jgi:hypothetical protein